MVFKRNGLRAAVGAAALAMVLVAGSPVQAKMYTITMTEIDVDGSTNVASTRIDSEKRFAFFDNLNQLEVGFDTPIFSGFLKPIRNATAAGSNFDFYARNGGMVSMRAYSESHSNGLDIYQSSAMEGSINILDLFTSV